MSKKPRGRSTSRDAYPSTRALAVPEPAVFRDMQIEEGRISDGRRIIYFSWPDDEPGAARADQALAAVQAPTADETLPTADEDWAAADETLATADEDWAAADLPPGDEDTVDV